MPASVAKAIFLDALEVDPDLRDEFVRHHCGDDMSLVAQVNALLAAHDEARRFMLEPTCGGSRPDATMGADPLIGARIGRYRIERLLGEGGFGSVYLASQEIPLQRRVAVKVLRPGMDIGQVIQRFEIERQALALMDHPAIAKVFDAGTTESGLPYFVMECVEGPTITAYCDARRLDIAQRIELFERVCLAVQHAHQKGVIHRDLKPSNVLVTTVDGQPQPKVIDFGIAKATQGTSGLTTTLTLGSQFLGTPQYMSPEQIGDAADVDSRADVYSLGVILYELLTGFLPFDIDKLSRASLPEIVRTIRDVEPIRPSVRAATAGDALWSSARLRNTDPARLVRLLREDLDWIVMRAIDKDRSRRYPAATDLADDLRRFLRSEPVKAGPPTASYRFSRFARRHRALLTAGGCVATAIVMGLVLAVTGLVHARAQRASATASLEEAEAVTAFLTSMLGSIDPRQRGQDARVSDVVAAASGLIDTTFGDRPNVAIRLHQTVGRTFREIGDYTSARHHLGQAYRLAHAWLDDTHPLRADSTALLASLMLHLGHRDEAASLLEEALELARLQSGPDSPAVWRLEKLRGDLLERLGDLEEAERVARAVLEKRTAAFGPDAPETLASVQDVAALLMARGAIDEAEPLLKRAHEGYLRLLGPDHPDTLGALSNLAEVHLQRQELEQAERLWTIALEGSVRTLGHDHPETIATRNNMATVCAWLGRYDEAEQLFAANLEAERARFGPEHARTLGTLNNLGVLYGLLGRHEEELATKSALLATRERLQGPDHPDTLLSCMSLGRCLLDLDRTDEALPLLERSAVAFRTANAPGDLRRIEAAHLYADALMLAGRTDEAEPFIIDGFEGKRVNAERAGASSAALRAFAEELLLCELESLRDAARAVTLLEQACAKADNEDPDLLEGLALALHQAGDIEGAIAALDRAIARVPAGSDARTRLEEQRAAWRSSVTQPRE